MARSCSMHRTTSTSHQAVRAPTSPRWPVLTNLHWRACKMPWWWACRPTAAACYRAPSSAAPSMTTALACASMALAACMCAAVPPAAISPWLAVAGRILTKAVIRMPTSCASPTTVAPWTGAHSSAPLARTWPTSSIWTTTTTCISMAKVMAAWRSHQLAHTVQQAATSSSPRSSPH